MTAAVGYPGRPLPAALALSEESLLFLEAWRIVDRAYVDKKFNGQSWFSYRENALKQEPMSNREETYAAIRRMLATLDDPFTRFLEPERYATLKSGTSGAVTGVGLEVGFNASAQLSVVAPVSGGPADRAGISPGDLIVAIDGTDIAGSSLYDVAQRLQGPIGTSVVLSVLHNGDGLSREVTLTRETIDLNPVSFCMCSPAGAGDRRLGYIRLAVFNKKSAGAVREAIGSLQEGGADALVLDIRNNGGGLFPAGVEVARMLLDAGDIVFISDNVGIRDSYEASGAAISALPLAVLVNRGTASASEILAGALKDNKRALLFGDRTFGKGLIQSVFELSDGSGLAVTVARYETPAHIDINKVGVTPDYPLPADLPLSNAEDTCAILNGDAGLTILTRLIPSLALAKNLAEAAGADSVLQLQPSL